MRQVCILQDQLVKTEGGSTDGEMPQDGPLWDDQPLVEIQREVRVLIKAFMEQISSSKKGAMWHHELKNYSSMATALTNNPQPEKELWWLMQQRLRNLWAGLMSDGGWGATGASAEAHSLLGTKPKPQSSSSSSYKYKSNSSSYRKRRRGGRHDFWWWTTNPCFKCRGHGPCEGYDGEDRPSLRLGDTEMTAVP